MRVHNILSLLACRYASSKNVEREKSMERLSSGLRLNRAADDASGLAISERMRSKIRGLSQADRNILDGISLVQTADGGLGNIHELLQRMREILVQASNGVLAVGDREAVGREIVQLTGQIDSIANNTEFNGIKLLNGARPHQSGTEDSSGQQISNVLSPSPVGRDGRMKFATLQGYPTTSADDNKILIYGQGSTSRPSVRINGSSYVLTSSASYLKSPTQQIGDIYQTIFEIDGVEIIQSVQIVGQLKDKYEIKYEIKNVSGSPKIVGFQYHIDTMLGSDDNAPFIINGNVVLNETKYVGSDIPNEFTVYNQHSVSGGNPKIQAVGILKTTGDFHVVEEPSQFAIGHYSRVDEWGFSPSGSIGDSGYSIWWSERVLNDGQSFVVNTFYGLSVPSTVSPPTMDEEGPFDIQLQVGSDAGDIFKIQLSDVRAVKLGVDDIEVFSSARIAEGIGKVDSAIQKVSHERIKYGTYQNALEHINANVKIYGANSVAAESRITDADMAMEITSFVKRNILNQSAQAMLSQANQMSQGIVQLLKQ